MTLHHEYSVTVDGYQGTRCIIQAPSCGAIRDKIISILTKLDTETPDEVPKFSVAMHGGTFYLVKKVGVRVGKINDRGGHFYSMLAVVAEDYHRAKMEDKALTYQTYIEKVVHIESVNEKVIRLEDL